MSTKDENLLVKLAKKSVGISTGPCGCGSAVAAAKPVESSAAGACCEAEATELPAADCCEKEAQAEDVKPAAGA